jgi:hypothetical protein
MLNDFLYNIDANTILLALLFVVFFAIINFGLSRALKDRGTSSIISFCISLLAVYGINKTSLDLTGFFSGIGLTENIIYSIVPIVIVVGLGFMIWRLKLSWTLILTGVFLIIISLTSIVYEKTWVLAVGIALLVLGIILLIRSKRNKNQTPGNQPAPQSTGSKSMLWYLLIILVLVGVYAVISKLITFIIIAAVAILILLIIIFKKR